MKVEEFFMSVKYFKTYHTKYLNLYSPKCSVLHPYILRDPPSIASLKGNSNKNNSCSILKCQFSMF